METTEETKEFLGKCKTAGYEFVAILCRDKRVPRSMTIRAGAWFGDLPLPTGDRSPIRVVSAYPEQRSKHFSHKIGLWPKLWNIVNECGFANGMCFGGFGLGDAHEVNSLTRSRLTAGCYDLSKI